MAGSENERVEFKSARTGYAYDDLCEYCVAIANEGGGRLVLGVTNDRPRTVVGTGAARDPQGMKHRLLDTLHIRVDIEEIGHPGGRVLVFHVPARPIGMPLNHKGRFLMRSGESLVPMSADQLRRITEESKGPDFTEAVCPGATPEDLDSFALTVFRERWHKRTGNSALSQISDSQLLEDSELTIDGGITYAALILLGQRRALGRHLAQAEVIFEYRSKEGQIESSQRFEFRQGFLTFHDELWTQINARNEVTSIREGLFRREIQAFNEDAVREAVLNAVCHRDYRLGGSVFVRQYPKRLAISSPGGLPQGITPENILRKQFPRNRRLAEACGRCGLVERSGQGMDRIFDSSVREAKGLPEFDGTDDHEVVLTIRGEVLDKPFLQLLNFAEQEGVLLNVHHLVVLDLLRQGRENPPGYEAELDHLVHIGLVERIGRGRGSRQILSRGMYHLLGEPGSYTRYRGLDRGANKQLLLDHARSCGERGASLSEYRQVLPQLTRSQVRYLISELRHEGQMVLVGRANQARWISTGREKP